MPSRSSAAAVRPHSRLRLAHRAPDDSDEFAQIEGLRQIIISAALGRLDRGHEGVLRAHDDDRQIGPQLLDARQKLEGIVVRHDDIGDDEIALAGLHPAPERRGIAGRAHLIADARQRLAQHRPDCGIIIGDENIPSHCSFAPEGSREPILFYVFLALRPSGRRVHRHEHFEYRPTRLRLRIRWFRHDPQ